MTHHQSWDQS